MANERVGASAVIAASEVLLAFVVPASGLTNEDIDTAKLSAALSRALPAYMVPRRIRVLEALPLTPNGKVDRRALAAYAHDAAPSAYVAPRNPVESKLAAIFGEVLDLDANRVSIEADFFELGGHSLLATRVATRIRDRLHRDVPLQIFFEAPTVAGLAARLDTAAESFVKPGLVAVRPEARPDAIPLSFAQERLWFLDQLNPKDAAYTIPLILRFRGALDVDALEQALNDVVRRHEVLRTTFVAEGGQPRQLIHAPNTPIAREAARIDRKESWSGGHAEPSDEAWQLALKAAQAPFDLAHGPLLRTTLIRLGKTDHLAVLSMHHIVSDGWSVHVLAREMAALYAARRTGVASPLPPLPIQYVDWSLYERATANRAQWDEDSAFWAQALQGVPDALKLPTRRDIGDGARVAARHRVALEPDVVSGIHKVAQAHDATLFMVLLAAYAAALYAEGAGNELVVGCPSAGREDLRVEPAIGFFVNTLPLRLVFGEDRTLREIIDITRDVTRSALAHRSLPFARMAELAAAGGQTPKSLGQLWFVLQNGPQPLAALDDLKVEPVEAASIDALVNGRMPARYELKLELQETVDGGVRGGFEYRTD
ncbi:MAG: condensation domain-containing protein, partial [Myxococcota bacterium]